MFDDSWSIVRVCSEDTKKNNKIRRIFAKMQTQAAAAKKLGHIRRPSYGKVTPISTLLLNLSGSSSIRHDGVSPDLSEPSHVFSFGTNGPILQHHQHQIENDDVANVTTSFIEQEKLAEQNGLVDEEPIPIEAAADLNNTFKKCVNYHHAPSADEAIKVDSNVARDTDDIDNYLPNGRNKPCLICNVKSQQIANDGLVNGVVVNQPLKELCETLCNDRCKSCAAEAATSTTPTAHTNDTSGKVLARSNSSRQEFLASMLQEATTIVDAPKTLTVTENEKEIDTSAEHAATPTAIVDNYLKEIRESLTKTSMMTSPAAKRRLAARKMEMSLNSANFVYDSENSDYIPPKELLMYLVR